MIKVQSFGDRHPGRRRKNNEDFVAWFEPIDQEEINSSGSLYILADGVGGAVKGERASQYAAQKVLHGYYHQVNQEPAERLRELMAQASYEIFSYTEQSGGFNRMATTMVAAIVHSGKLTVAHVGDSRAYLIRGGVPKQLTRDHSIVGEMIANGDMTEAQAQSSKIKNRITRSIGGEAEVHVDVHSPIPLQAGDKILLCSDGLTRYALQEDIATITAEGSPREIVDRLIKFANKRGGADNVSAILIHYGANETLDLTLQSQRPQQPQSFDDAEDTIPGTNLAGKSPFAVRQYTLPILLGMGAVLLIAVILSQFNNVVTQAPPLIQTNSTVPLPSQNPLVQDALSPTWTALPSTLDQALTETPQSAPTATLVSLLIPIIPSPWPEETRIPVSATVLAPLNVRAGPGTDYPRIAGLETNQLIGVQARTEDGQWLFVIVGDTQSPGWIFREYVEIEFGGLERLPVAINPTPVSTPVNSLYPEMDFQKMKKQ